jgi:hypothetical protein
MPKTKTKASKKKLSKKPPHRVKRIDDARPPSGTSTAKSIKQLKAQKQTRKERERVLGAKRKAYGRELDDAADENEGKSAQEIADLDAAVEMGSRSK